MKKKIMMIVMINLVTTTVFLATPEKQAAGAKQAKKTYTGQVISTMESGGYTYIEFEEEGKKFWAVGPKPGKKIIVTPGSVKKLEGGYTVAECFAMKKELKGKELSVRGIVVKFAPRILGRNWLHIKDGTGEKGSDDLTVTTAESVRVGDLIIVKGIMACDKNFGAGYFYPVIIEDASIIVE